MTRKLRTDHLIYTKQNHRGLQFNIEESDEDSRYGIPGMPLARLVYNAIHATTCINNKYPSEHLKIAIERLNEAAYLIEERELPNNERVFEVDWGEK